MFKGFLALFCVAIPSVAPCKVAIFVFELVAVITLLSVSFPKHWDCLLGSRGHRASAAARHFALLMVVHTLVNQSARVSFTDRLALERPDAQPASPLNHEICDLVSLWFDVVCLGSKPFICHGPEAAVEGCEDVIRNHSCMLCCTDHFNCGMRRCHGYNSRDCIIRNRFCCYPGPSVTFKASFGHGPFRQFIFRKQSLCCRIQASYQQQRPVTSICCPSQPWGCTASLRHRVSFKHRWKNRILLGYSVLSQFFVPCLGYPGQGPDFTFASINLGSCVRHFYPAVGLSDFSDSLGFICAQETRIPPQKARRLSRDFKKQGWDLTLGPQPPLKRLAGIQAKQGLRQQHGGVAAFGNERCVINPIEISNEFAVGRFVHAFHCVISDFVCIVVNCYLPSGNGRKREREANIAAIFEFAATLGDCPIFVCGDFQSNPSCSKSLSRVLSTGDWCDVPAQVAQAHGLNPQPTFVRGRGSKIMAARIDSCFANSPAMMFVKEAWVEPKAGFPDHRPLFITLSLPEVVEKVFQIRHSHTFSNLDLSSSPHHR